MVDSIFKLCFACFAAIILSPTALRAQETRTIAGSETNRLRLVQDACEAEDPAGVRFGLVDPSPSVRQLAVACPIALVEISWAGDILVNDPDRGVRRTLAANLGAEHAELLRVLLSDLDPRVQEAAIERLAAVDSDYVPALSELLWAADLRVAIAAAEQLNGAQLGDELSPEASQRVNVLLSLAADAANTPELVGAVQRVQSRTDRLVASMTSLAESGDQCAAAVRNSLDGELDELVALVANSTKGPDAWALLTERATQLSAVAQGYYVCTSASPLGFSDGGPFDSLSGRHLLTTTEFGTRWDLNFGPLRADPVVAETGELWSTFSFDTRMFLPGRDRGESDPQELAFVVGGEAKRDQLFVNESLSRWNGGGFVRVHVPLGDQYDEQHRLTASGFALRSAGAFENYPRFLLARHRRVGLVSDLTLELGDDLQGAFTGSVEDIDYEAPGLGASGMSRLALDLAVDGSYQIRFNATGTDYHRSGPNGGLTAIPGREDRDGWILTGTSGVRIGEPSNYELLELRVVGGVAIPILPEFGGELNPQVVFDLHLVMGEPWSYGEYYHFKIGGERRYEHSPGNYATQSVVSSYVELLGIFIDGDMGLEGTLRTYYSLVDPSGAIAAESLADRQNVVGGRLGLRWFVLDWLGFHVYDQFDAVKEPNADFLLNNRFFISLFVPTGGYAFGLEEPAPW